MRILIVGAGGFIGGHIARGLMGDGHRVICAGRNDTVLARQFPTSERLRCDLAADTVEDWSARLTSVDAVVNAAGILRGDFQGVQDRGPQNLFTACAAAGIRHVVQISGLGAARDTPALFLSTKAGADERLRILADERRDISWTVLRPGVVIGAGGQSTALFEALAAFPFPLGIGNGQSRLSIVAVEDLVAIVRLLLTRTDGFAAYDVVAEQPTTDEMTRALRSWLGLPPRPMLRVPYGVLGIVAWCGTRLGFGSLTGETLAMLRADLEGDAGPLSAALGWQCCSLQAMLTQRPARPADRKAARFFWLRAP